MRAALHRGVASSASTQARRVSHAYPKVWAAIGLREVKDVAFMTVDGVIILVHAREHVTDEHSV